MQNLCKLGFLSQSQDKFLSVWTGLKDDAYFNTPPVLKATGLDPQPRQWLLVNQCSGYSSGSPLHDVWFVNWYVYNLGIKYRKYHRKMKLHLVRLIRFNLDFKQQTSIMVLWLRYNSWSKAEKSTVPFDKSSGNEPNRSITIANCFKSPCCCLPGTDSNNWAPFLVVYKYCLQCLS